MLTPRCGNGDRLVWLTTLETPASLGTSNVSQVTNSKQSRLVMYRLCVRGRSDGVTSIWIVHNHFHGWVRGTCIDQVGPPLIGSVHNSLEKKQSISIEIMSTFVQFLLGPYKNSRQGSWLFSSLETFPLWSFFHFPLFSHLPSFLTYNFL